MRRMLLVLTVAALVAATMAASAAPAMARDLDDFDGFVFGVDDDFNGFDFDGAPVFLGAENEAESGGVAIDYAVSNEGDYASQCTPALQFGQTGNLNNAPGFAQFGSLSGDFEADGIEFTIEPGVAAECDQAVQQSSAASS